MIGCRTMWTEPKSSALAPAPTAQVPDPPSPCVHLVTARLDAYWCFPVHGR
jgi:hypothetical protein